MLALGSAPNIGQPVGFELEDPPAIGEEEQRIMGAAAAASSPPG
jgi:hypothetical protein